MQCVLTVSSLINHNYVLSLDVVYAMRCCRLPTITFWHILFRVFLYTENGSATMAKMCHGMWSFLLIRPMRIGLSEEHKLCTLNRTSRTERSDLSRRNRSGTIDTFDD